MTWNMRHSSYWKSSLACLGLGALVTLANPAPAENSQWDEAEIGRTCPGLAAWVERHSQAVAADKPDPVPPTDPELRTQLLDRMQKDQQVRSELFGPGKPLPTDDSDGMRRLKAVDDDNLAALYRIVADYDIPTRALVGGDGIKAFWLLVQHAQDTRLQQRVLAAFTSIPDSGVPLSDIALLDDRINSNQGRPQKYGTQFKGFGKDLAMAPVEDEAHLDERREKMGLPPIADYRCMLNLMYGGPQH